MENIENSHMAVLDVSMCQFFFNQKRLEVSMIECIVLHVLSEVSFSATYMKNSHIK